MSQNTPSSSPTTEDDPAVDSVTVEDVASIAGDVWQSFLGEELVAHPLEDQAPDLTGRTVTGCVQVSGVWKGSIFLQVGADLAAHAAEQMFMADPGTLSTEEVCDGLGELTNMVGGNIKSLLPGPSALSLPSVAEGADYVLRVPGAVKLHTVVLVCAHGPVHISIWKA
jgi:chemotaxis protein CheX